MDKPKPVKRIRRAINPHRCSYCGQTDKQVKELFKGPNSMICNECVEKIASGIRSDVLRRKPKL